MLGWFHLAAMASIVPFCGSPARRTSAFRDNVLGVAWIAFAAVIIPASVPGEGPSGSAVLHVFDPGRMLRASFEPASLPWGAWWAALMPALGWSLMALWLARRAQAAPATPNHPPCATPSSETSTPI
jgi:hypothetical protein